MSNIRSQFGEALPVDLSASIEKSDLMRMVFDAIEAAQWPKPLQPLPGKTPEPVLRSLLVYCYACGIYPSAEIESLAQTDAHVRYLCANDIPDFEELRNFRRQNISWLRQSLAHVFRDARTRFSPEDASIVDYTGEANQRLAAAVAADSAALDY